MTKPLVSIIIPCYNGADTITRALTGIVQQTYRPIQLIVVNDGSTDNSDQIIRKLEPEICKASISFIYIVQKNLGLGGAINTGLQHVVGSYLGWVDADDELLPKSIELRVSFLEEHPDFGSISSDAFYAEDTNWENSLGKVVYNPEENSKPDQFLPMLLGRSTFCCGCHLVRTEVFRRANGGMAINPFRYGQNMQLLLPVYYSSKHAFLNIPLYKYRINAQSMSSEIKNKSLRSFYSLRKEYIKNTRRTLQRIQGLPKRMRKYYEIMFRKLIYEGNLDAALQHRKSVDILLWKAKIKLSVFLLAIHPKHHQQERFQ